MYHTTFFISTTLAGSLGLGLDMPTINSRSDNAESAANSLERVESRQFSACQLGEILWRRADKCRRVGKPVATFVADLLQHKPVY